MNILFDVLHQYIGSKPIAIKQSYSYYSLYNLQDQLLDKVSKFEIIKYINKVEGTDLMTDDLNEAINKQKAIYDRYYVYPIC